MKHYRPLILRALLKNRIERLRLRALLLWYMLPRKMHMIGPGGLPKDFLKTVQKEPQILLTKEIDSPSTKV